MAEFLNPDHTGELTNMQAVDEWRDGKAGLPPTPATVDDCVRRALHFGYGIDWPQLPHIVGDGTGDLWPAWMRWADRMGLAFWFSREYAPVSFPRWIACIERDGGRGPEQHAVVAGTDRLLFDPSAISQFGPIFDDAGMTAKDPTFVEVASLTLDDVIQSVALLPKSDNYPFQISGQLPPGELLPIGGPKKEYV